MYMYSIHTYSYYDIIILYDKKINVRKCNWICWYCAWNENKFCKWTELLLRSIHHNTANMNIFKTKELNFTMGGLEWLQTQVNHLKPAATWVISSRKMMSKMAADSGSLFFANLSNVLGWTSSPLKKGKYISMYMHFQTMSSKSMPLCKQVKSKALHLQMNLFFK